MYLGMSYSKVKNSGHYSVAKIAFIGLIEYVLCRSRFLLSKIVVICCKLKILFALYTVLEFPASTRGCQPNRYYVNLPRFQQQLIPPQLVNCGVWNSEVSVLRMVYLRYFPFPRALTILEYCNIVRQLTILQHATGHAILGYSNTS